ncbi:MAG: R3H domain-containing nucleic acid-binding protein [Gammaproteobacteria bacterium]
MTSQPFIDDLQLLTRTLPHRLQAAVDKLPADALLEVVLDLGRRPQARLPGRAVDLSDEAVSRADLEQVIEAVGEFGADNRAGIEGTLHRISAIRNRRGEIVGLTLRVGRAMFGTIDLVRDLIEDGRSVLLLGRPGVGKTTKLREMARVLADEFSKRVIVIDTSNEIAGDGNVPHRAIGSARRMQVAHPDAQHAVMIEAVENHMPEVIIIDEIGTTAEALAARTIAERGVQLIGTAHGNTLENLLRNPTLSDLVGGVQVVTLGDEEARLRGTQKTISERRAPPTFAAVIEIVDHEDVIVHSDSARAVDRLLRGRSAGGVRRTPAGERLLEPEAEPVAVPDRLPGGTTVSDVNGTVHIYPYAISRDSLERVLRDLRLDAVVTNKPERAHLVVALRARADDPRLKRLVQATGLPVHTVKKNSTAQMRRLLQNLFNLVHGVEESEVDAAVRETEAGLRRALEEGVIVELAPRPASLRRLQHRVTSRHHVVAESVGSEPQRHLVIYPHAFASLSEDDVL